MFENANGCPTIADSLRSLQKPSFFTIEPPSVHAWLRRFMQGLPTDAFPYLCNVNETTKFAVVVSEFIYIAMPSVGTCNRNMSSV